MRKPLYDVLVIVRGAGELGTAVACALYRACIRVLILEAEEPTGLPSPHTFVGAMFDGEAVVEGITAVRPQAVYEFPNLWGERKIPVYPDSQLEMRGRMRPDIYVDARDPAPTDTQLSYAWLLIALGRNADIGREVHTVVGVGKQAGQLFWKPCSIPEQPAGRVLAPADGEFEPAIAPGDRVTATTLLGTVGGVPVPARWLGRVRALARKGRVLRKDQPVARIGQLSDAETPLDRVSLSARATAGGVLEAILAVFNQPG